MAFASLSLLFPTEGPDGVSEELGALEAGALEHPEGQQHETPQVSHQQRQQRGHRGQQRVCGHLPDFLQLSPSVAPSCGPCCWLGVHPRWERPSQGQGWGGTQAHTHTHPLLSLLQTSQTGKWAVPPGTVDTCSPRRTAC